jgi:hypothetical protein
MQNGRVIPYLLTETDGGSGGSNRWRLGGLGARVRRGKRRGAEGDLVGMLTDGTGVEGRPESGRRQSSGWLAARLQGEAALQWSGGRGNRWNTSVLTP